jgi:hypothetical protein
MRRNLKEIRFSSKTVPVALAVLCLISFAPLIAFLGFYWDDWPSVWFLHFWGPTIFPDAFAIDRPLQGWLFVLTTSLVGESILAWQVFGILTRLASSLALWWVLRLVWPGKTFQTAAVAILFLLYPGFAQQYIPFTYSHMFIVMTGFFISLGIMILAYRKPPRYWPLTALSVGISLLCMFTLEYFLGLELLRPAILWLISEGQNLSARQRLGKVARQWAPYLAVLGFFAIWRYLNETPRAEVILFDNLRMNPLGTLSDLAKTILQDLVEVSALAWGKTLGFSTLKDTKSFVVVLYGGVALSVAVLTTLLLSRLKPEATDRPEIASKAEGAPPTPPGATRKESRPWALQAIGLGAYALLAAGWPFWVTNLHIELYFPWDRFTLSMMLGTSLLLVGLIDLIGRRLLVKAVLIGLAAGLAAGLQIRIAMDYRQDWTVQREFFWQLTWRVPGLEPGTLLLTPEMPFRFVTDNSLTAPVNWIYAPQTWTTQRPPSRQMPFLLANVDARLEMALPDLEQGTPVEVPYRATYFKGSTSQALTIYYDPPRCLKVFDPAIDYLWPNKPDYLDQAIRLSRPELILTEADPTAQLPPEIFGSEPKHNWCYYFEKAELARQRGAWEEAARLGDQALALDKNFTKETAPELIPFIEGYARAGQWSKAVKLSLQAYKVQEKTQYILCLLWRNIQETTPPSSTEQAAVEQVQNELQCK